MRERCVGREAATLLALLALLLQLMLPLGQIAQAQAYQVGQTSTAGGADWRFEPACGAAMGMDGAIDPAVPAHAADHHCLLCQVAAGAAGPGHPGTAVLMGLRQPASVGFVRAPPAVRAAAPPPGSLLPRAPPAAA